MPYLDAISKMFIFEANHFQGFISRKTISQGKPFNITVIQIYAPTSNAEEAEVEWFYKTYMTS